jgi:hypothetical protein
VGLGPVAVVRVEALALVRVAGGVVVLPFPVVGRGRVVRRLGHGVGEGHGGWPAGWPAGRPGEWQVGAIVS